MTGADKVELTAMTTSTVILENGIGSALTVGMKDVPGLGLSILIGAEAPDANHVCAALDAKQTRSLIAKLDELAVALEAVGAMDAPRGSA